MLSIKDIILLEDLDADNLVWKLNTWFSFNEEEKRIFFNFMNAYIQKNSISISDFEKMLTDSKVTYRSFLQFVMDNVSGTEEYDQLYIMKKVCDLLKANKSLSWTLTEANEEDLVTVKSVEAIYTTETSSLVIQVPDNYNEDNIQMYLDDTCMQDMPNNDDSAVELFGEENASHIVDVYFKYNNLTIPEDATIKPDLEWNKRYDNKADKNAKLMNYSLDGFEYVIVFDEFVINNFDNKQIQDILKNLFENAASNKIHPWAIEIILDKINFKKY